MAFSSARAGQARAFEFEEMAPLLGGGGVRGSGPDPKAQANGPSLTNEGNYPGGFSCTVASRRFMESALGMTMSQRLFSIVTDFEFHCLLPSAFYLVFSAYYLASIFSLLSSPASGIRT